MKTIFTLIIVLFFLCVLSLSLHAQNPTYEARLMNGILTAPNKLEFDIYVKRTGTIPFEAYGLQVCLIFNDEICNGGTLSAIYVPGTSEMNSSQIPGNINLASVISGKRVFKLPAKIPSGPGAGTILSDTGNGTRLGRFRISTTTSSFALLPINLDWNFSQTTYGYATKFNAYVGGLPNDITVQSSHLNELNSWDQLVTYESRLMNDVQVNSNTYEFDVYLKTTSEFDFLCCGLNFCLLVDDGINGGGEITSLYVGGSSQMNTSMIPGNPDMTSLIGNKRVWKLFIPISESGYTLVSKTGNGTRLGRFQIKTNASSFSNVRPNLKWNFNSVFYGCETFIFRLAYSYWGYPYPSEITDSTFHLNNLFNPILPIELVSFNANLFNDRQVVLNWNTATETNNSGFDIERSIVNDHAHYSWQKIGFVPGSGNSTTTNRYSHIDKNLSGGNKFAYRLKQIDHDGSFNYSTIQTVELILNDYVLSQNYPNPFNPTTTIEYIIPQAGQVTLVVYNLLGEKVSDIVNEMRESGIYTVDFDASNLSSGSYIYLLRSNGNTISKKMAVIK